MDIVDSMEEVFEKRKKEFCCLIKFGSKENLIKLQHGEIYMKNLKFYNDLEAEEGSGKPDKYDGKWQMRNSKVYLKDPNTGELIASGYADSIVLSFGYEKFPIYCFFGYDSRNFDSFEVDKEKNICKMYTSFTEDQIEKLESGLGDYALIIKNPTEFLRRIDAAFKSQELEYVFQKVSYNMGNSVERAKSLHENEINIAFNKDENFAYQQEYRFLIINKAVEDHLIVHVDSLEDITQLIPTNVLLNLKIEIYQDFIPIQ